MTPRTTQEHNVLNYLKGFERSGYVVATAECRTSGKGSVQVLATYRRPDWQHGHYVASVIVGPRGAHKYPTSTFI